jgi:hypothetical protein
MSIVPAPTKQLADANLELDDEGTGAMCGGTGCWPGLNGYVDCKPCLGTGLASDGEAPQGRH